MAGLIVAAFIADQHTGLFDLSARVTDAVRDFSTGSIADIREGLASACELGGRPDLIHRLSKKRIDRAMGRAVFWYDRNIRTIIVNHNLSELATALFAFGPVPDSRQSFACVLNSRIGGLMSCDDPWVVKTRSGCAEILSRQLTIVSSFGTPSYDFISVSTGNGPKVLICPEALPFFDPKKTDNFLSLYSDIFDPAKTLFLSPFVPNVRMSAPNRMKTRDRLVAACSDVIFVGELRSGGIMSGILQEAEMRKVEIVYAPNIKHGAEKPECRVEEKHFPSPSAKDLPGSENEIETSSEFGLTADCLGLANTAPPIYVHENSLIHFTRSCQGPWPGQSIADYYRSIYYCDPESGHTGFDALKRILREKIIRASGRLTIGGVPVVSFTECSPRETAAINQWRTGLRRWAFEPYGLAFPKQDLFELGTRPVIYSVRSGRSDLAPDLLYLFQVGEENGRSWYREKEWRIRGDLHLIGSLWDNLTAVVPNGTEALELRRLFSITAAVIG